MADSCRDCNRQLTWVTLPSGKRLPVDPVPYPQPKRGLVAVNPARATGKVLSNADLEAVPHWQAAGATVHSNHYVTCPVKAKGRRRPRKAAERVFDPDGELARVQKKFPEFQT